VTELLKRRSQPDFFHYKPGLAVIMMDSKGNGKLGYGLLTTNY